MRDEQIVQHFRSLSSDEKLDLLRRLWTELEADAATRPLTDDQRRFLDERLRDIAEDDRPDRDWHDVRTELLSER